MNINYPCIWFTGLSGAGKTALALGLQNKLSSTGIKAVVLDGDLLRKGLNNDLGFTENGRIENIRLAAEVAKLFSNEGIVVICAFISPTEEIRGLAKQIIGESLFFQVFIDTPLNVCIKRDVKGLYAKAMSGQINNFTGISAVYERPVSSDLVVDTSTLAITDTVIQIANTYLAKLKYNKNLKYA